jgi:hypothetical protein
VPVVVRDLVISDAPVVGEPEGGVVWLSAAFRAIELLDRAEGLQCCAGVPVASKGKPIKDADAVAAALRGTPAFRAGRLHVVDAARWSVRVSTEPCAEAKPSLVDAGAPDADRR